MTRLRIPGPTPVPERVRNASHRQVLYHRSDAFSALLSETTALLKPLFGTSGVPLLLTASGTGGLEAALSNTISPGDRVIALDNGHWGRRFGHLAESLGGRVEYVVSDWGGDADVDTLRKIMSNPDSGSIRAVLVAHNDTFTGAVCDIGAVGEALRGSGALLIVDAVSSLGTMPVEADAWCADIVVSGSQKGLMSPPGLAFLCVSDKAWSKIDQRAPVGEYWDLRKARKQAERGQTVFTPAVSLVAAVHEALCMIHEEGIPSVFQRHRLLSEALRRGVEALGLGLYAKVPGNSPSVSVIRLPEQIKSTELVRCLRDQYGTIMTGARNSRLDEKVIRVGTMGYCFPDDIRLDVWQLAQSLGHLGYRCDGGNAMEACEQVFDTGARK